MADSAEQILQGGDSSWLDTFSVLDPKAYLDGFLKERVRPDGRLFHKVRPTVVNKSVLTKNSVGSALIKLGKTQVLGAITLETGQPAAGFPNQGDVVVTIQQQDNTSLSSSWIEKLILGSLDLKALCIQEGKAAWRLRVVLQVLNNDGNVRDAALLAAIAALSDTALPRVTWNKEKVEIIKEEGGATNSHRKLKLLHVPVPLTIGLCPYKENGSDALLLLVDPSPLEKRQCQGSITMVVSSEKEIFNIDYCGKTRLSSHELSQCAHMAFGRAQELSTSLLV